MLLLDHTLHGAAYITTLQPFNGHDLRRAIRPNQADLGVPVSEHMDMGRHVIIDKMMKRMPWAR
jgi:hypothetical protein